MTRTAILLLVSATLACTQPAPQTAAPAPPDTAAVRSGLRASADQAQALYLAGDAAGVAGLYTADARAEFQGFPSAAGRAAIESTFVGYFAANKLSVAEVTIGEIGAPGEDRATALGTFHSFAQSEGKPVHAWWRYAAAYRKEADGVWRISYIMAFPDSTK